jgi:hypothetical protein
VASSLPEEVDVSGDDVLNLLSLVVIGAAYCAPVAVLWWIFTKPTPAPPEPTFDEVFAAHPELAELGALTEDNWLVYFELFPLDGEKTPDE